MACVRQFLCFLLIILMTPLLTTFAAATSNISLPGCPNKCGSILIPYPFGMGNGCDRKGFEITCDESMTHPRAILFRDVHPSMDVELINVNITTGEARVYNKNISYKCFDVTNSNFNISMGITGLPWRFPFSYEQNKFLAIGCSTLAFIVSYRNDNYFSGCVSTCFSPNSTTGDGGSCNGMGCCQAAIPSDLYFYAVYWHDNPNYAGGFNLCSYAVLVEDDWYKFQDQDLQGLNFYKRNKNGVPVVLNWAIRDNGTCQDGLMKSHNTACRSNHSFCYSTSNGMGYLCQCRQGYEGNPYLTGGCIDIDECKSLDKYPCSSNAICINSDGNFTCSCPKGTYGNPYVNDGNCIKIPEKFSYHGRVVLASLLQFLVLQLS